MSFKTWLISIFRLLVTVLLRLTVEYLPPLKHLEPGELVHIATSYYVPEGFYELLLLIVALVGILYGILRHFLTKYVVII